MYKENEEEKVGQEAVQGDVIIKKSNIPGGVKKVTAVNGLLVIAKGEATGHAHTVEMEEGVELWEDPRNKELYLSAVKEVTITHQEHAPVTIQPGTYKIGIIQEYDYFLEESRKVKD